MTITNIFTFIQFWQKWRVQLDITTFPFYLLCKHFYNFRHSLQPWARHNVLFIYKSWTKPEVMHKTPVRHESCWWWTSTTCDGMTGPWYTCCVLCPLRLASWDARSWQPWVNAVQPLTMLGWQCWTQPIKQVCEVTVEGIRQTNMTWEDVFGRTGKDWPWN